VGGARAAAYGKHAEKDAHSPQTPSAVEAECEENVCVCIERMILGESDDGSRHPIHAGDSYRNRHNSFHNRCIFGVGTIADDSAALFKNEEIARLQLSRTLINPLL
jgi:hypothetical protein